jgi:hypothetical protein
MIQTPMSDKMIAEGQGEELNKMLKNFVPMGRLEEIADAVQWLCNSTITAVSSSGEPPFARICSGLDECDVVGDSAGWAC